VPSHADWLFAALIVWLFVAGSGWQVLLADGDTGWHIRAGEYILAHREVPHADLFSFTRPGAPWCAWEWLSDVLFALAHRAAGLKGVVLLAGAVIASAVLPTLIANTFFLPRHLLPHKVPTGIGLKGRRNACCGVS